MQILILKWKFEPKSLLQDLRHPSQDFSWIYKFSLKPEDHLTWFWSHFFRLVQGSEDINIVLQISPHKGFTVKEKIKRALSEEIIAEGAYR